MAISRNYYTYHNMKHLNAHHRYSGCDKDLETERAFTYFPRYQKGNTKSHRRRPPRFYYVSRIGERLSAKPAE